MNIKKIIATFITFFVGIAALDVSYNIFQNAAPSVVEKSKTEETKDSENERSVDNSAITNKTTSSKDKIVSVDVQKIENTTYDSNFAAQGRLRAYDKLDLIAEIPGMMLPVNKRFKVGTRYTEGETIFRVDDAEARFALQAQKAQLHTAITQMMPDLKFDLPQSFENWKNYLAQFDMDKPLKPFPNALSEQETYFVSLKGIQAQYYNIKSAEFRLTKYQVVAPFDGIVTTALIGDSGYLRAGSSLGTIMNTYNYELETAVPIADLQFVKIGNSVKVVSEDTGKNWTGKVKRIADIVDAATQTATVYIGLSGSGLREGQYLKAIIKNGNSKKQVASIPKKAIIEPNKVAIVENSTVKIVEIDLIKTEGNQAIINGLDNETNLITDASAASLVGQKVTIN